MSSDPWNSLLVERMLSLYKSEAEAKMPRETDAMARQIEATDRQIDPLVYELYGPSDAEIRLVEEA